MCKNRNFSGTRWTEGIIFFMLIVVVVFAILFLQKAMEPKIPEVSKVHTELKTLTYIAARDSAQFTPYAQRLDSMQNDLNSIRDQYQMDIDIGIDRLNNWIGFWLAILTMVLLLGGIWQYLQVKKHDDDWDKIKNDFDEERKNLNSLKDDYQEKMDEKAKEIEKELAKLKVSRTKLIEKFQIENSIFNLLRTMSAIQDPMMLMPSVERKKNIYEFLDNFQQLMRRYSSVTLSDESKNEFCADECLVIRLIYTNLMVNLCRCSTLYTSPSASLAIRDFLKFIKEQEETICFQKTFDNKSLADFLEQFGHLMKGLNLS